jgi:hypothetical protein
MKRMFPPLAAGAAFFAAGWWIGHEQAGGGRPERKSALASAANPPADGSPHRNGGGVPNAGTRGFIPARPFPKGQAREWLESFLQSGDFGDQPETTRMTWDQYFFTMDEDSATEAAEALKEMFAALHSGDADSRRHFSAGAAVNDVLARLAFRLSQFNSLAALELMNAHPDDERPALAEGRSAWDARADAFQRSIIADMVTRDPREALAMAVKMPLSSKGCETVRSVLEQWKHNDRDAATAWAEAYSGPAQTTVKGWALERYSWFDQEKALTEFAKLQRSARDQQELAGTARELAEDLASDDITSARDWVDGLGAGAIRNAALPVLVREWLKQDAEAASAWISKLPAGKDRDTAAVLLVSSISSTDSTAAAEWARNIQDPKMRQEVMHYLPADSGGADSGNAEEFPHPSPPGAGVDAPPSPP